MEPSYKSYTLNNYQLILTDSDSLEGESTEYQ